MKKSLQAIEDYYYQKGLRGDKLRQATENDSQYIRFLKERHSKLTNKLKVKASDKKKYNLSTDIDYEILAKIYQLENKKLSSKDTETIKLIRTQLERDWRMQLIKFLNRLLKKYK